MITSIGRNLSKHGIIQVKFYMVTSDSSTTKYKKKHLQKFTNAYGGESITYDYASFVQLDYNNTFKEPYSRDKRFTILSCQVWKLVEALKQGLDFLNRTDVFYIDKDTKKTCLYAEAKKYKVLSKNYMNSGAILIEPTVVADSNDVTYEGLRISFNRLSEFVDLSIDEIKGLLYTLEKTDFVALGQLLLNSTILWGSSYARAKLDAEETSGTANRMEKNEDNQRQYTKQQPTQGISPSPFAELIKRRNEVMANVNVTVLKGRLLLATEQHGLIEVQPFNKNHLIKYMGYYNTEKQDNSPLAKDPYIYIYRGKLKSDAIKIPGSIYKSGKELLWVEHDPEVKENFRLSNCKELSKDTIKNVLDNPKTKIKEITPELLDFTEGDIFAPQIRDNDDLLKRVIKTTLQKMHLNIKTLRSKFDNDYDLNNLKSQLVKEGAMSSKYFKRWVEILGIQIEVIVTNQPGSNKLDDEVTIVMK